MRSFASDNYSGIHESIMQAIQAANIDHCKGYGECDFTKRAINKFKDYFGEDIDVYFVLSGTASNVLALHSIVKPYHSIICASTAHINTHETGAPDFLACKIIGVPHRNGKISPKDIFSSLGAIGDVHSAQPKVISITQPTEVGTVYSIEEIKAIADLAHKYNMYLHMDGSRLSNAAVALGKSFKEMTIDCGVDVLSFGGTKNGMMLGESVVFFNKNIAPDFKYIRKNMLQLYSKMRFVSCQFEAFLSNDVWKKNALHANDMAKKLEKKLKNIPEVKIIEPVETNAIFASLPKKVIEPLRDKFPFYIWNETQSIVRFMTNFDTTEEDINEFCYTLVSLL